MWEIIKHRDGKVMILSKENLANAGMLTAILTGVATFIMEEPKTINSILVFIGFCLSSLYWFVYLWKDKLTAFKSYLCAMGLMLQMTWTSIPDSLSWAWIGSMLFIIYVFAFVITFDSEIREMNAYKHA